MKHIVIKFVFFIPQTDPTAANVVHRGRDSQEVFEKFGRDIFVDVIFHRELERDAHQIEGKHSHPAGAVALLEMAAVRKRFVTVEYPDVVEPEKSTLEDIVALGVLAIHPPGEGDQHFVENRLQKCAITFSGLLPFDLINAPCRPCHHRRVHIAEVPLVGWDLAVRMLIPLAHN